MESMNIFQDRKINLMQHCRSETAIISQSNWSKKRKQQCEGNLCCCVQVSLILQRCWFSCYIRVYSIHPTASCFCMCSLCGCVYTLDWQPHHHHPPSPSGASVTPGDASSNGWGGMFLWELEQNKNSTSLTEPPQTVQFLSARINQVNQQADDCVFVEDFIFWQGLKVFPHATGLEINMLLYV